MIQLVYYVAASLDGFIATPDGGVAWLDQYNDPTEDYGYRQFYDGVDGLWLGRGTYDAARAMSDTWYGAGKPAWVFTHRPLGDAPPDVLATSAPLAEVRDACAARGLRRLWLMGGGDLATQCRASGLVTEYIVTTIPVLLGAGIPLLARGGSLERLAVREVRSWPNGLVQTRYVPNG